MSRFQVLSIPTRIDSATYKAIERQTHQGFLNQTARRGYIIARPLLEFLVSFIGLISLIPVFLVVGILIKATSRGPAFYAQERDTH